jgi:hypothetical protein
MANNYYFYLFFKVLYSAKLHRPPLRSAVSEDARIELRTVATLAMIVRRALTTRRDLLIHMK